jgi:tetratricopeptide (TPR) repeat protein
MKTTRPARIAKNPPPEAPARSFLARHRTLWPALLILLAGGAAYANSLRGVFLFDDLLNINSTLGRFPALARILEDPRPVVSATLALNYAWSASNPWSYHLVNVAVHVLAALALFGIVRRTLELPALAGRYGRWAAPLALTIAVLWMVHPLQTESVTYVIQRAESLMGLYYLSALYCLIRGHGSPHPRRWYAGAVASCLLGAGCKEVIVTLPVVALAYDALFLKESWRESLRRRWGLYLGLTLCCGLAGFRLVFHTADAASVGFGIKGVTPLRYALTQPGVILHYLRLSFVPWPLCLDYDWPLVRSVGEALPALLVVGVLLAVSLVGVVCGRRWAFPGLAFFCILAPTSSVVPIKDVAFEHRMYLPLAAVMAGAVIAGVWFWNRAWPLATDRRSGRALAGVAILAAVGLGFLTVRRNAEYQNEVAFWVQTARCAPQNPRVYSNLGVAYTEADALDEGIRCLDKALELDPQYSIAWRNRGVANSARKHYAEAVRDFNQAIALSPNDAEAWSSLGAACSKTGRPEEALHDLDHAIALRPDYAQAHVNRGNLHAAADQFAEAFRDYDQAIAFKPDDAEAWYNRGTACAKTGRAEEALRDLDRAISLKSDDPEQYYNRGNIHLDGKRYAEAIRDYGQAIALRRDYADAWYNRANAYAAAGRPAEAIRDYSRAIELRPQDPDAYYNRAIVRRRIKQDSEALADLRMVQKLGRAVPEELLRSVSPSAQPPR